MSVYIPYVPCAIGNLKILFRVLQFFTAIQNFLQQINNIIQVKKIFSAAPYCKLFPAGSADQFPRTVQY